MKIKKMKRQAFYMQVFGDHFNKWDTIFTTDKSSAIIIGKNVSLAYTTLRLYPLKAHSKWWIINFIIFNIIRLKIFLNLIK